MGLDIATEWVARFQTSQMDVGVNQTWCYEGASDVQAVDPVLERRIRNSLATEDFGDLSTADDQAHRPTRRLLGPIDERDALERQCASRAGSHQAIGKLAIGCVGKHAVGSEIRVS